MQPNEIIHELFPHYKKGELAAAINELGNHFGHPPISPSAVQKWLLPSQSWAIQRKNHQVLKPTMVQRFEDFGYSEYRLFYRNGADWDTTEYSHKIAVLHHLILEAQGAAQTAQEKAEVAVLLKGVEQIVQRLKG